MKTIDPDYEMLKSLLKRRASVRSFASRKVTPRKLRELIELATLAPSGQNKQPWDFRGIVDRAIIGRAADLVEDKLEILKYRIDEENLRVFNGYRPFFTFFRNAPALVLVSAKPYPDLRFFLKPVEGGDSEAGLGFIDYRDTTHIQSAAAAVMLLGLLATSQGLASCWNTAALIARAEISELAKIPPAFELVCLVALGYPPEDSAGRIPPKQRYSLDRVYTFIG